MRAPSGSSKWRRSEKAGSSSHAATPSGPSGTIRCRKRAWPRSFSSTILRTAADGGREIEFAMKDDEKKEDRKPALEMTEEEMKKKIEESGGTVELK